MCNIRGLLVYMINMSVGRPDLQAGISWFYDALLQLGRHL